MIKCLPRSTLVLFGLGLLLLLAWPPTTGHTDAGAHHGHFQITLGGVDETGGTLPPDVMRSRYEGTLRVEDDAEQGRILRLPVPNDSLLLRAHVPGHNDTVSVAVVEEEGLRVAIFAWERAEDAPATGTEIHGITATFEREVDPDRRIVVEWPFPAPVTEVTVRVEAPRGFTMSGARELLRSDGTHTPAGRSVWHTTEAELDDLMFSFHPPSNEQDPALAAPPSPLLPWFILMGIALVAGGAWAIAKRLEQRADRTAQDT